MCCMAAKPADGFIPKKYLKNMWLHNPHGMGFVAAVDGQLLLRKGFRSFKDFYKVYREYDKYPMVIHMRDANRGTIKPENDHPFYVNENLAFAHNGTVKIALDGDKSDTVMLNEKVLRPMYEKDPDFLDKEYYRWLIGRSIEHSKLAFIDKFGKISIINKHFGEVDKVYDIWFSNDDYRNYTILNNQQKNSQFSNNGVTYYRGQTNYSNYGHGNFGWE